MHYNTVNIALAINKPYLFFAMVTINSLLAHNQNTFLNINIMHDGSIVDADIQKYIFDAKLYTKYHHFKINLINITTHKKFPLINSPFGHWGKEIFYKIIAASIFPHLERLLMLDTDVICNGDIKSIYNTTFHNSNTTEEYLFITDHRGNKNNRFANVGVILLNLQAIRSENIKDKWLSAILNNNINEESAINNYFLKRIKFLDEGNLYTISTRRDKISYKDFLNTKFFHLAGRKPWFMSPFQSYGIRTTLMWYQHVTPFVRHHKKLNFLLVKIYGVFIVMFLYAFTKQTPLGKKIYKSAYTLLQKILI